MNTKKSQKLNNEGKLRILFCPAHFRFSDNFGSEYNSAYNLAHLIALQYPDSVVIAGKSDISHVPYRIVETMSSKKKDWMKDSTSWSTFGSILFAYSYMKTGLNILNKERFDVIHHIRPFAFGQTFNVLPFLKSNKNALFVIGEFVSPYSLNVLKGEKENKFREIFSTLLSRLLQPILNYLSFKTLRRADAILVTDEDTKKLVGTIVPFEKVHIIPHGKNGDDYFFNINKFKSSEIHILIAGNLIMRKRVSLGIRAFANAYKKNPLLRLDIAGDGIERENLENLVDRLGLSHIIKFYGAVRFKDMKNLYAKSHILLHVAEEEMFAHVYIEAMASGLPIISTNTIGARNILNDNIGIIVESDSIEYISNAISLLCSKDIIKIAKKARYEFETRFDLKKITIPQVIQIYKNLINSKLE
jgi:glycosyltransferase involved in cell wall biosynthesis